MSTALALAFGAGLVATINPCGFAMLPAYLSYYMGLGSDDSSRPAAIRTALLVGGTVSLGFLVVFGIAGLVITAGFRAFTQWIPWIALAVGLLVALLGLAMAAGHEPKFGVASRSRGRTGAGWTPVFGFGVSYGIASLSCTLPVFLVAVAGQLTQQSLPGGVAIFLAYTAGMASMLLAVTIVLALGKRSILNRLRASSQYINRVSGVILLVAGGFIVWFWTTEITSGATALGESATFRALERVQSLVLNFVADRTLIVGAVFGLAILAAAAYVVRAHARPTTTAEPGEAVDPVAEGNSGVDVRVG